MIHLGQKWFYDYCKASLIISNQQSRPGRSGNRKTERSLPTYIGKKKKRAKGPDGAKTLPAVYPYTKCKLRKLKKKE